MPNPLGQIIPILDLLGKELKILPATGGAIEDLQWPDQEEVEEAFGRSNCSLLYYAKAWD